MPRDYELMWRELRARVRELGGQIELRCLTAEGNDLYSFAKVALREQGRWLVVQELLSLLEEVEALAAAGDLGPADEEDGMTDGRQPERARSGPAERG